jgi:hypothetical protein
VILQLNTAATMFCQGNTAGAKDQLDELLVKLDMRVLVPTFDSKSILPSYLVNILVYLLLKTSKFRLVNHAENFKVARNLVKFRRFVQEEDTTRELNTAVKMFS